MSSRILRSGTFVPCAVLLRTVISPRTIIPSCAVILLCVVLSRIIHHSHADSSAPLISVRKEPARGKLFQIPFQFPLSAVCTDNQRQMNLSDIIRLRPGKIPDFAYGKGTPSGSLPFQIHHSGIRFCRFAARTPDPEFRLMRLFPVSLLLIQNTVRTVRHQAPDPYRAASA